MSEDKKNETFGELTNDLRQKIRALKKSLSKEDWEEAKNELSTKHGFLEEKLQKIIKEMHELSIQQEDVELRENIRISKRASLFLSFVIIFYFISEINFNLDKMIFWGINVSNLNEFWVYCALLVLQIYYLFYYLSFTYYYSAKSNSYGKALVENMIKDTISEIQEAREESAEKFIGGLFNLILAEEGGQIKAIQKLSVWETFLKFTFYIIIPISLGVISIFLLFYEIYKSWGA